MFIKNSTYDTKHLFIDNGSTEYSIVVPKEMNEYEIKAINEFKYLLNKSCNISINVTTDECINKGIYLGQTKYTLSVFKPSYKELGSDGYMIKTINDNLLICGVDRGTLFGVYSFFERFFGYKYYAENEMKIDKKLTVYFNDLDIIEKPDIDSRSFGYFDAYHLEFENVSLNADRLKIARNNYSDWILAGHTYFTIMPKSKYLKTNRDFYSPDEMNLCLSNPDIKEEFSKNVFDYIKKTKGRYFMIGQEDNFSFCDCDKCKKKALELGGESGVMIDFSNSVVRRVQEMTKKENIDRDIKFISFAYNKTSTPPTKPIKTVEGLSIMYVPFGTLHNYPYTHIKNAKQYEVFNKWKSVTNSIFLWDYCANFDNFFIEFDDYKVIKDNYAFFKDMGVEFIFDQGPYCTKTPCFDELKLFLRSKLAWDTTLSFDDLYNEFMDAYYKEISPHMKKYLKLYLDRWEYIHKTYNEDSRSGGCDSSYYLRKEFFPKEFLFDLFDILNDARGKIEENRIEDWDTYLLLKKRLKQISISSRYIFIKLYGRLYGDELPKKINSLRRDMNECNVLYIDEGNNNDIC